MPETGFYILGYFLMGFCLVFIVFETILYIRQRRKKKAAKTDIGITVVEAKGGLPVPKPIEAWPEELKQISDLLVSAHNKFVVLERQHPNEIEEWLRGIHQMQDVLAWRILRRDYPNEFPIIKPKK